ncbi:MAG: cation:proton antiporter [Acidimicrobiaceae bacterium]|nr:cation:proton antiporter [Acidimicrobiaceae bacterium]MDE0515209.1 cation:proton antiporter [Acidimicrobiaceae bacterium]MDE0655564.1 cation:proton antiporter [Acidimicrobiaceae bacterium]MXZ95955.1 cation:proton antiporter [Acidimicrobiaceae bacterium]MYF43556.1 cation:proton antiporter [Acidimicrobiaceae bacterium]
MDTGGDLLVIELGALVLALAIVARLARRIGLPALPLYLLAGLVLGEGSLFELDASEDFIEVGAEIGVILMLLMLGLEFSTHELINNVRRSTLAGVVDLVLNFTPGFVAGLILGFDPVVAVLLGGVTYISSSGIVAKLVADLDRIGNHETSVVLSVLVIEDLAMVLYLPIVSGVLFGGSALSTTLTVAISLAAVLGVLGVAYLLGDRLSAIALSQSSEALLLTLLGGTLLVAGIAGRLGVSTAVGAFVVGVALSGDIVSHARGLLLPLRNLFAAVFFVFFGLKVDLDLIPGVAVAALAIAAVTVVTKIASGWIAAARAGIGKPGRLRAGAALIAHGEFSIVIAELGIARESDLGALAAAYVIILTLVGAVLYQFSDSITLPTRRRRGAFA